MLEDAMQGDQLIAMATLVPGFEYEYYSRPPIAPVVCIGRVTAHAETDRGTYVLKLAGLQRAEVLHEIEPVRSFRRARVEVIGSALPKPDKAADKLRDRLVERILETLPWAQKLVAGYREGKISLASLADAIAFHLPLATELKLRLLAEADVMVRAELLLANLPPVRTAGGPVRRYPKDFSAN
jgi:Lon protease-like protein